MHEVSGPNAPTTDAPFEDEKRATAVAGPVLAAFLVAALVVAAVVVDWHVRPEPDLRQVVLEIPAVPAAPSERNTSDVTASAQPTRESRVASGDPGGGERAAPSVSNPRPFAQKPASDRVVAIRSSILRAQPGPYADTVASVAPGEVIARLSPAPVLGYFRVRHGGQDGWVWWLDVKPAGGSSPSSTDRGQ